MRLQTAAALRKNLVADLVPGEYELKHDAGDAFLALWQSMSGGKPRDDV